MASTDASRRRVIDALSHREPERIPVDFGGSDGDGPMFRGGGVDRQRTPRSGAPGGGFVFDPVYDVQAGAPDENAVAMPDGWKESKDARFRETL